MKQTESSPIGLLVATGPSLTDIPLEFLQKHRTYSMNGIFLLEGFTPDHYFCCDPYFMGQKNNWENIEKLAKKTEVWIRWPIHAKFGYGARPLHRTEDIWGMEPDILSGNGHNISYAAMQVAFWHGIRTLLVVGMDHDYFDFAIPPKHFESDDKYRVAKQHGVWERKKPGYGAMYKRKTENDYAVARQVFELDGGRIINLTEGTELEVFEKGNINDW